MAIKIMESIRNLFGVKTSAIVRTWGSTNTTTRKNYYSLAWYVYRYDFLQHEEGRKSEELGFEHINYVRDIMTRVINHFTAQGFSVVAQRNSEILNLKDLDKLTKLTASELTNSDKTEKDWYKEYLIKTKYIIPYIQRFWKYNEEQGKTFRSLVEQASVSGDLFIYLAADIPEKNVQMYVFDAEHVTIIPDELNLHKIQKAIVEYEYEDYEGVKKTYKLEVDSKKVVNTVNGVEEITEHNLGEIPFIHIAFNRTAKGLYGTSDVFKLLSASMLFNEKISDISEIIAYHASPITVVKGAKLGNLEKSPNKIWSNIPKDADIFNLEMSADLGNSMAMADRIENYICTAASYPKEILAGSTQIKSHTSGVAMQYVYKPLEDSLVDKEDSVRRGFNLMHRIVIKILNIMGVINTEYFDNYDTDIQFNSRLPKDEMYDMQVIAQELLSGITSVHEAMRKRGKTNPESILKEIWEETISRAQLEDIAFQISGESPNMVDKNGSSELRKKLKHATDKNVGNIKTPSEEQSQENKDEEID